MGILIKDADVLQSTSHVDTVVFDKNRNLDARETGCAKKTFAVNNDSEQLLTLAASIEKSV
ncbi:hypothetical protein QW180_14470 [Vibrio sinaloensis]|nr:hypothetical protein [Vibrio sinaloensis]